MKHRGLVMAAVVGLVSVCLAAGLTGLWVLTAAPIGFLFGFFLRKGELCGASAFSEVILMKDGRKLWGLWVAIVTGMAGFAVLDLLGLVQLNPKPLLWASLLVGGVLFGVGIVLAGGCVSGTLYKAGAGHMNSLVALLGIPIGVAVVEYGPLSPLQSHLNTMNAGRVTFSSITNLPFWAVAAILVCGTLAVAMRRRGALGGISLTRSWKPWQAGLLIGVLGSAAYLSSAASGRNYPLGVTHGVLHAQVVATDQNVNFVYQPPAPDAQPPEGRKVSVWLIALVVSLVAGSWFASRLAGEARLIAKPPEQLLVAVAGSLLVGAGAALAGGCVIGNILSGVALMSVGSLFFAVVVMLSNWATTYVYLRGADS